MPLHRRDAGFWFASASVSRPRWRGLSSWSWAGFQARRTFVRMTETGTTVPNIAKVEQLARRSTSPCAGLPWNRSSRTTGLADACEQTPACARPARGFGDGMLLRVCGDTPTPAVHAPAPDARCRPFSAESPRSGDERRSRAGAIGRVARRLDGLPLRGHQGGHRSRPATCAGARCRHAAASATLARRSPIFAAESLRTAARRGSHRRGLWIVMRRHPRAGRLGPHGVLLGVAASTLMRWGRQMPSSSGNQAH